MKLLPPRDTLEIEVTDFGPIVEAKVDLRPLTVFVGPSNTGKSYLAILIYALHRFFGNDEWHGERLRYSLRWNSKEWRSKTAAGLAEFMKSNFGEMDEATVKGSIALTRQVAEAIRSVFDVQGKAIGDEISRCFGYAGAGELIRKEKRDHASVVLRGHGNRTSAPFDHKLTIGTQETTFVATIPAQTSIPINAGEARELDTLSRYWAEMPSTADRTGYLPSSFRLFQVLGEIARRHVVGPLHFPAFYLPADRTGVMHAHSAFVSALIGSAPIAGMRPSTRMPMLSGVLADFVRQLIEPDRPLYRPHKALHDVATRIEETILGGSVLTNPSEVTGYPHFAYRPDGWKSHLPLMYTSSMVSELAPVVFYLRRMVEPNNVLIVEEPESHLHPAMQVEFTRQLALLVHSGVRVIVTTHSEWVLDELANIVRRSALPKTGRKETAGAKVALHPDDVGAWLFKPRLRPKGSVVEEVKLDHETGLYPTDYDAVSEALYNESASIFNRIQGSNS